MKQELKILKDSQNPFEVGRINLLSPWEDPLNSDDFNLSVRLKLLDEITRFAHKDENAFSEFRVLVGDKGEGKTHILCNLRDQLIRAGQCLFIYIHPATLDSYNYSGADAKSHIYYHILNQIEDSIFRKAEGKQGNILITNALNQFVIPLLLERYEISIKEADPEHLEIFNKELRQALKNKRKLLDSLLDDLYHDVCTSYISQSKMVDHDTVYLLFKYALYNSDLNNKVNLSKWLKGVKIGETRRTARRIARVDKALSVIKTINDIIVRSGKHLVIVFDQFERTVSEKQIIDNLKDGQIETELYEKLDEFFTNIWKLMEEVRKIFFIFSLREENWKAFKAYLRTVRSHLESRFSDLYVVKLEEFTEDKAFSILQLFFKKLVYEKLGIKEEKLVTQCFPYFKDDHEKLDKSNEYLNKVPLQGVNNLEVFTETLSDKYYLSESDDGKRHIIRNYLEECAKSYIQLIDAYRYQKPIKNESFFPDCSNMQPRIYISHDFYHKSGKERSVFNHTVEQIRMYSTTLITEYAFIKNISVSLPIEDIKNEIDFEGKRLQRIINVKSINESDLLEEDVELKFLLSIQFPEISTPEQLRNCIDFLNKRDWSLSERKESEPYERSDGENIKRIDFNHSGSFDIENIEKFVDKLSRNIGFVNSVRLRNTAKGKDVAGIRNINYQDRQITVYLPHRYTSKNNQAKIILGLSKKNTPDMMDKAKNILQKWIARNA